MAPEHAAARILIVDDYENSAAMLERLLRSTGYQDVRTITDSRHVLPTFAEYKPDLIILDIRMPHLDGFAVLRQIQPRTEMFLPVLMITGDTDTAVKEQALATGATDFLHKPFDATEVILRLRNLLRLRFFTAQLETDVQIRTAELHSAQVEIAQRLALAAELRDYAGGEHTQRVGDCCAAIARALGLTAQEIDTIRLAATLHDIGKIAIPDNILLKTGPLTLEEFDVLKQHTTIGARMLSGSRSPILQAAEEIALYHHENWNGTGYTPGLQKEKIPVAARIARVADVFDALTHRRPYKQAWEQDHAISYLGEHSGSIFDPSVVAAFFKVRESHAMVPDGDTLPLLRDAEWEDLSYLLTHYGPVGEEPPLAEDADENDNENA